MADLTTTYLGMELKNPLIAGASGLTADMETIGKIVEAGAGALVTKSLMEEEIQLERFKHDEDIEKYNYRYAEMIEPMVHIEHAGPEEHLMWVRKTVDQVDIPVIGSLNAVEEESWLEYAKKVEQTGVAAIECNFFSSPGAFGTEGAEIEREQLELVGKLADAVAVPVAVKLSALYSNPANIVIRAASGGAAGVVLFNRFFEHDIDIEREELYSSLHFSRPTDYRLPLRYTGLLADEIAADICCSTGIFDGRQAAAVLLAGAKAFQVVSTLYTNGVGQIASILDELGRWMDDKGYADLAAFRGKLSRGNLDDPLTYSRLQYARLLMHPEEYIENVPRV